MSRHQNHRCSRKTHLISHIVQRLKVQLAGSGPMHTFSTKRKKSFRFSGDASISSA